MGSEFYPGWIYGENERWDPDLDPQFVGIGSRLGYIPFNKKTVKISVLKTI